MNTDNIVKITKRAEIEVTGVNDISSYDSEKITIKLSDTELVLTGKCFNIKKLDTDNHLAIITGHICSLCYNEHSSSEAKSFLKSLFK